MASLRRERLGLHTVVQPAWSAGGSIAKSIKCESSCLFPKGALFAESSDDAKVRDFRHSRLGNARPRNEFSKCKRRAPRTMFINVRRDSVAGLSSGCAGSRPRGDHTHIGVRVLPMHPPRLGSGPRTGAVPGLHTADRKKWIGLPRSRWNTIRTRVDAN